MAATMKTGWIEPASILFAAEIPANERAFAFAVAQAAEFGADLILFHAYDTMVVAASEQSGIRYYDYAAASRAEKNRMEPLVQRVLESGVRCEVVVRPGLPADQILAFTREREIDRIVMGTHSPGPIGKLLVGSVAEAVLRRACTPVYIVGPDVVDGNSRNFVTRTVLAAISLHEASPMVAAFAAELAARRNARLILQHVIRPQDRAEVIAGRSADRSIDQIETTMLSMIPVELAGKIAAQAIVVPGDPTQELLYQSKTQQADLIVLGARGASAFAAVTRQGVVYKVLAHSQCPVMTLSPTLLAGCGSKGAENTRSSETYMAGVF